MLKRYFVTGTDTEVGKTVSCCALLQAANQRGYLSAGYKPVASGSTMTVDGLRNYDALMLQANSSATLSYSEVNYYIFPEPTAPHIISAAIDCPIKLEHLSAGLRHLEQRANWLLIEGAGGWFTPLSSKYTFADWVSKEQLPVILVVGVKIGCINHALLSAQAICQAGLLLVGWIANNTIKPNKQHKEYLATLCRMISAPLLGEIPNLPNIDHQTLGSYLDIHQL